MRTVIVAVVLAAGVLHAQTPVVPAASTLPTSSKPAVVVLLMVDQFRTDYIARYGSRWTGGLRRLVDTPSAVRAAAHAAGWWPAVFHTVIAFAGDVPVAA